MIRVGIVEDQREIRDGLKALLSGTSGYHCADAWHSMEEALEQIGRAVPDVLLVDIGLPGMSGTEGIRLLKQRYPALPAPYTRMTSAFSMPCAQAPAAIC